MSNSTDIAAHASHAAMVTAKTLAEGLGPDQCFAVHNVLGEHEGFMPLLDGGQLMTDPSKAKLVIEALTLTHAHRIQAPRLIKVRTNLARAWFRIYAPGVLGA
jgi:hypothetical protein